jgi:hypothetical protein
MGGCVGRKVGDYGTHSLGRTRAALIKGEAFRRVTHYVISPLARADLDNIWEHTSKRGDDDQAETYLRMI